MSTIHQVPENYPKEIIGYAQPWIVSPGDKVDIKVSCTEPTFNHRTVRILQGYEGKHSPPKQVEEVGDITRPTCAGRFQLAQPGSYLRISNIGLRSDDLGVKFTFYAQPWITQCDHVQTLFSTLHVPSCTGAAIVLDKTGSVAAWVGLGSKVQVVSSGLVPEKRRWIKVDLEICACQLKIRLTSLIHAFSPPGPSINLELELNDTIKLRSTTELLLAASRIEAPEEATAPSSPANHLNGRLDTFIVEALGAKPRILVHYDFSIDIPSDFARDVSGNGLDAVLVNAPSRAMKGYSWDSSETDWTKARSGYGAIHFHGDDLDDAAWDTDFSITVPSDARSGVYGVELRSTASDVGDTVVFFVRPTESTTSKIGAKVAMVMSTFTYLAYANEHQFDPDTPARADVPGGLDLVEFYKDETFHKQDRRRDLGLSCYDVHRDWSAVLFSSAKRPLLNCRPGYVNWTGHRPRELSAELIMQGYLERLGIAYDVVTDHDLHTKGSAVLKRYTTIITGCHPEYHTLESYSAYEGYLRAGGNLMYLGGNGFYWSSAMDTARYHRLEVRRGGQGVRISCQDPGERHFSLNGHVGGLWRDRGKAANYLVGVGCCGEGAGPGVPYRVAPDFQRSYPRLTEWLFENVDISSGDLTFGRNALGGFGGGASADEIDRADPKHGSPSNIVIIASSTGHPDRFGLFPEDAGFPMTKTLGTQTNMIRSDMTYYETSGGGAVFSVGSISWYCALGWEDYRNDVATITGNVLKKFMKGRAP